MVAIHHGTFELAFRVWHDPCDQVVAEATKHSVALSAPQSAPEFGQVFTLPSPIYQLRMLGGKHHNQLNTFNQYV